MWAHLRALDHLARLQWSIGDSEEEEEEEKKMSSNTS